VAHLASENGEKMTQFINARRASSENIEKYQWR